VPGAFRGHFEGFDLHAAITVAADDRAALERLARYVLRPPVAQDRLALTPEGQVLVTLKAEWADGTTHLLFAPVEFLEKLAALTPRPRINLVIYHGILAPHARARAQAVARGPATSTIEERPPASEESGTAAPAATPEAAGVSNPGAPPAESRPRVPENPRNWAWADLMRRVFDLDVLACPRCGGRMSVIATIGRTGTWGSTASTRWAASSAIRRPPQLGQKPCRLQEKGTRRSKAQPSHRTRAKPRLSAPQVKNSRNSRSTKRGSPPSSVRSATSRKKVSKCSRTTRWRTVPSAARG
jgi:hypothetical protein